MPPSSSQLAQDCRSLLPFARLAAELASVDLHALLQDVVSELPVHAAVTCSYVPPIDKVHQQRLPGHATPHCLSASSM